MKSKFYHPGDKNKLDSRRRSFIGFRITEELYEKFQKKRGNQEITKIMELQIRRWINE